MRASLSRALGETRPAIVGLTPVVDRDVGRRACRAIARRARQREAGCGSRLAVVRSWVDEKILGRPLPTRTTQAALRTCRPTLPRHAPRPSFVGADAIGAKC